MEVNHKKIHAILVWIAYGFFGFFSIAYCYDHSTKFIFMAMIWFWIASLLYFALDMKRYLIIFFFFLTMCMFLFSRPLIEYIYLKSFNTYNSNTYQFSFFVLILSMAGLVIGGIIGKHFQFKRKKENIEEFDGIKYEAHVKSVRIVSLLVFLASYPFYVLRLVERYMYRRNTTYYEYYASFHSELPYIVYLISVFMFFSMCVYLATKPSKKQSNFVTVLYIMANTIYLLIGTRNPFILSLLFCVTYYCMRHFQDKKEVWIGSIEKFLGIVAAPIIVVAMGILNYVRDDVSVAGKNILEVMLDFVYKQGTSFGVLAKGYMYECYLPVRRFRNYVFGPIIDYVYHGSLGNTFFGTSPLPETNSLELAYNSNSYAHNLSYAILGQGYLDGHGVGSSFVMETYMDYRFIGVILFSFILGFILVYMMKAAYQKSILLFALSLVVLENIFFTPRASYLSSFFSLFTMQFWVVLIIIFAAAGMLEKFMLHKKMEEYKNV